MSLTPKTFPAALCSSCLTCGMSSLGKSKSNPPASPLVAKLEALRCHVSQETDKNNQLEERIKTWLEANRLLAGWEEGRFAEAFLRVTTN